MDDKYYIDLTFTAPGSSTSAGMVINATAPTSSDVAVPGYYMLVIVNANGVPSVMPFIQLNAAAPQAPKKK